jgi:hypothetical protein
LTVGDALFNGIVLGGIVLGKLLLDGSGKGMAFGKLVLGGFGCVEDGLVFAEEVGMPFAEPTLGVLVFATGRFVLGNAALEGLALGGLVLGIGTAGGKTSGEEIAALLPGFDCTDDGGVFICKLPPASV